MAQYITKMSIILCVLLHFCGVFGDDIAVDNSMEESTSLPGIQDSVYPENEEKWLENALKDIAYYLRNHKFNEWDRRYYNKRPIDDSIGFYKTFPIPNLKSIHWEVHRHCRDDFYKCITYLHKIISTAPFTRSDDISTYLNKYVTINSSSLEVKNNECHKGSLYSEKSGLPFSGPQEKFKWRTTASYYMCWYTMKGVPELSMLGESCDNFANCLDKVYGNRNHDPRADDKSSFACAMYSFCPDPCCPLKHVRTILECHNSTSNPCNIENANNNNMLQKRCGFERRYNKNFDKLIENRWNVSCFTCPQRGFKWDSQFGMCVDINECTTKKHKCDLRSQDCLNLPGTYQCICKWGYMYDKIRNICIDRNVLMPTEPEQNDKPFNVFQLFQSFIGNII